jgi:CheY-like chemotaxis protein
MSRVIFIHWNTAEAKERVKLLRVAGYAAELLVPQGGASLRPLRENPPHAFVIDLSRLPSQGCAVAVALRQQESTRRVPLVFVEGEPEKVERVRGLLPDAEYTEWARIGPALRRAIKNPPSKPSVPGTMASYAGTPLVKKLGIRVGALVALLGAPARFERKLGKLPSGVRLQSRAKGGTNLVLLFAKSRADLARRFPGAARGLAKGGGMWLIWPKKASGMSTDLTQSAIREFGLAAGFVDYKICAVDEKWSGLLFARRRASSSSSRP